MISRAIFTEPKPQKILIPDQDTSPIRHFALKLISYGHWNVIVLCLIVLNAILLAVPYYGMDTAHKNGISAANHVLGVLFAVELVLRITAYGTRQFFLTAWNKCAALAPAHSNGHGTDIGFAGSILQL